MAFGGGARHDRGAQVSALSYPHLLSTEISRSTEEFYRRFYFRPRKLFAITKEMLADRRVMRRRLREGQEFLPILTARRREAPPAVDAAPAAPRAGQTQARLQVVLSVPRQSPMIASVPAAVGLPAPLRLWLMSIASYSVRSRRSSPDPGAAT